MPSERQLRKVPKHWLLLSLGSHRWKHERPPSVVLRQSQSLGHGAFALQARRLQKADRKPSKHDVHWFAMR